VYTRTNPLQLLDLEIIGVAYVYVVGVAVGIRMSFISHPEADVYSYFKFGGRHVTFSTSNLVQIIPTSFVELRSTWNIGFAVKFVLSRLQACDTIPIYNVTFKNESRQNNYWLKLKNNKLIKYVAERSRVTCTYLLILTYATIPYVIMYICECHYLYVAHCKFLPNWNN